MSTPDRSWLLAEFERAKERAGQVPEWARPVVVKPLVGHCDCCGHRYAGDHVPGQPCPCNDRDAWEGRA